MDEKVIVWLEQVITNGRVLLSTASNHGTGFSSDEAVNWAMFKA